MANYVFFRSVLDARSFAQTEMGREIGWLYNAAGIHVIPASAKRDDQRIPMVKELLRINPDLTNPITGEKGSPRMFFFKTLRHFIAEWQDYVWMEGKATANAPEKPKDKDNHLVGSCLSYAAQIPMRYMGEYGTKAVKRVAVRSTQEEDICETTGY